MDVKLCNICGNSFSTKTGWFTRHLFDDHDIELKDYVIQYELGKIPKCKCGCDNEPDFYRGKFKSYCKGHKKHEWKKNRHIEDNGIPICKICGNEIKRWNRGKHRVYCSTDCSHKDKNNFNQHKINQTVNDKYGVNNVFQLDSCKDKIKKTCLVKYGNEYHQKTKIFKDNCSKRAINNIQNGISNIVIIKKYKNTELYYQGSYEKEFLELCEKYNILDKISNGNSYKYIEDDNKIGYRLLTDFSIGEYEIEIKSTYIMKKQGGIQTVFAKKRAVESTGKKYIFILDKDYNEFNNIIKQL